MRFNDAVSGVIIIALAALMIVLTLNFPPFPGQKYGPSLFPRILGVALIICGSLLIVRGVRTRTAGARLAAMPDWWREPWRVVSFLLIPLSTTIYIVLAERIGFIPVAFVLLLVLFLWFRTRPWVAVLVAGVATWSIHWFFASAMRVPLPRGILTNIL